MPAIKADIRIANYLGPLRQYQQLIARRQEATALLAADAAAQMAKRVLRETMRGAGLGSLGQAIDAGSDLRAGNGVKRRAGGGFSASGWIFIRSGSRRSRGAIEAYTQGAEIAPVRSRWLWIATDQIPRVTGRFRMTPELWNKNGFNTKIGPLVQISAPNGNPLLIVRNVGVSAVGRTRSARSLTKRGTPRKGQIAQKYIVAFIGIPRTSRAARVNVRSIMRLVQQQLPRLYLEALGRTF